MKAESLIPEHQEGIAKKTHESAELTNVSEARQLFMLAKDRLLNVSQWQRIADGASGHFLLTDQNGKPLYRPAQQGDYVRINLPAPGRASENESGYDWVILDIVKEGEDEEGPWIVLNTRPSPDPTKPDNDTSHFFSGKSSGTFVIRHCGKRVEAFHYGRNEQPNKEGENLIDKVRDIAVAIGAFLGLSDVQWSNLLKGFLSQDEKNRDQ